MGFINGILQLGHCNCYSGILSYLTSLNRTIDYNVSLSMWIPLCEPFITDSGITVHPGDSDKNILFYHPDITNSVNMGSISDSDTIWNVEIITANFN